MEYIGLAFGAWFLGFFPLAEIYVAVPAALAAGLDDISAIFWTVTGNITPILLIHFGFEALMRIDRIRNWMTKMVSDKAKARFDKWGIYFILLATPWTGVWVMGVSAKALRIEPRRFIFTACASVFIYAVVLVLLLRAGQSAVG
jgi:uncharacterized membrane protein